MYSGTLSFIMFCLIDETKRKCNSPKFARSSLFILDHAQTAPLRLHPCFTVRRMCNNRQFLDSSPHGFLMGSESSTALRIRQGSMRTCERKIILRHRCTGEPPYFLDRGRFSTVHRQFSRIGAQIAGRNRNFSEENS